MKIAEPEYLDPPANSTAATGRAIILACRSTGEALLLLLATLPQLVFAFQRRRDVVKQLYVCGVKSFAVTSVVALFTGMILSLQAGLILREYGQEMRVGTLVTEVMVREMGPFMTALILAASVGSAMAAEIGTMAVSEEIAALHVMSINPVRFLVMPRLVAMVIMCPVLTVYSNLIGSVGGMLVAYTQLQVPMQLYYDNAIRYLDNYEVYVGLFKAVVFGVTITIVACYHGLSARYGAVGVGRATRLTVVRSFLLVLVIGYFITRLCY